MRKKEALGQFFIFPFALNFDSRAREGRFCDLAAEPA